MINIEYKKRFENLNLNLDTQFYERCNKFILLLQQWGKIHNLTASLKSEEIIENILDSIYPLTFINQFNSFADIGTGAGYPGLLIAMVKTDKEAILIEPRSKRVAFLNFVKSALKLDNVKIIQDRVENLDNFRVDSITSRAVSKTSLLFDLTKNITNQDSEYLFYKGSLCKDEIAEAEIKNYKIEKFGNYRNYLFIEKGL